MKNKIRKLWLDIKYNAPKPLRFPKQAVKHPLNKIFNTGNSNTTPEKWSEEGFLCLCCQHLQLYNRKPHADTGPTIGYYVCDHEGCRKTATHELMPGLKKHLRNLDEAELV